MKEFIERAAAIEAIRKYQYPYGVEFLLSNIPAADVVEVRHGRWETDPCNGVYDMRCSACGFAPGIRFYSSDYCPNCGALMREVENGEK